MSEDIQTKIDGQTFYQILGLEESSATEQEIKTSYRKLALKYHPDKVAAGDAAKDVGEMFVRVKTAYETLIDPQKKLAYDKQLEYERTPRPARRASTFASGSNNATYGGSTSSSTGPRYTSYTTSGGSRRTYTNPDILDDLLRGTQTFGPHLNGDRPRNGARVRRTADGYAAEFSFSFGSGGRNETGGYSPPPPPMHPSIREQKARNEAAERRRGDEEELARLRERRRLRERQMSREEQSTRDRERERVKTRAREVERERGREDLKVREAAKEEKKKGGLGSFIGKVAKNILGELEQSDSDTYSSYSSGDEGRRKSRRSSRRKGGREREREREREKVRY